MTTHFFRHSWRRAVTPCLVVAATLVALAAQQPPAPQQPAPTQPTEVATTITGGGRGTAPRMAVPDFIPLSPEPEVAEAVRVIAEVLADDLRFEREFSIIPRDTYATIPRATSLYDVALDRWRELNADGVIVGTVQRTATGMRVEIRLVQVRTGDTAVARRYENTSAGPREFAHHIADELHESQVSLRGVARTKLTFNSDRDGERLNQTGIKEIYVSDYDGFAQRRVTTQRSLNIASVWTPDGKSLLYTSWRRGTAHLFISNIYEGTMAQLTSGEGESTLGAVSPDGTRIAFSSTRHGNYEIYVMNRDGSNVVRITNHPGNDIVPTWSPSGTQIAFTSDRGGSPQIYIVSADGLGAVQRVTSESYADRATWSPPPYNEIAYAARTGPGFDIKVVNLATREVRQLTFGEGSNESPAFAPNGRHIAFVSTRAGKSQIFTIAIDGNRQSLRQITRTGNNYQPNWSR
jgi:TolB protein